MEKLPDPNANNLSFTTEVDTLKIKLKKGNHNLTIEAEEKELTKLWSRTISDSEAKSLTKDTFLNSEELYLGLQSAFTEKSSDVTIKVSKTGSIHYCLVVPFKGFKRTYEFNIDLKEVEEDEVSKLKRIVQALSARCKHLEEVVDGKSHSPTKSPNKDLTTTTPSPSIISSSHQRLFLAFDQKTAHASHFTYLNNDKKLKNLTDDGFWYTCFTKNAIPAKGKHYFEVRFTGKGSFMIGVGKASAKIDTKPGQYNMKSCISYYSSNGGVYENGTARLGGCLLMSGDVITVKVDMENLILSWELGGVTLSHARISKEGLSDERDNLYPCVHLYDNGDECELV